MRIFDRIAINCTNGWTLGNCLSQSRPQGAFHSFERSWLKTNWISAWTKLPVHITFGQREMVLSCWYHYRFKYKDEPSDYVDFDWIFWSDLKRQHILYRYLFGTYEQWIAKEFYCRAFFKLKWNWLKDEPMTILTMTDQEFDNMCGFF